LFFFESEPAVAFGYGEASGRFEKDSSPPGNQCILSGPPSATCRVVARRAKPERGGSGFSLGQLTPGSKDLSAAHGFFCRGKNG